MAGIGAGISGLGSAASDIFAGMAAKDQSKLKAKGIRIGAEGTRLSAESLRIKARSDITEAGTYDLAAGLARQNKAFTETSTAIKSAQQDRDLFKAMGATRADVAGAGFAESGSALDILRDSASQGALAKAVLGQQGLITEAGYEEQAKSYETMSKAGRAAAESQFGIADRTDAIAAQEDQLAFETIKAGNRAATGAYISGGIKAIGSIAGMFI